MSDVTLLRKLTRKSLLKYGWHSQKCVEELLLTKPIVLVKDYFNLSAITFIDEVLDELGIQPENRIPKPGRLTFTEANIAVIKVLAYRKERMISNFGEEAYMRSAMHAMKVKKIARKKLASKIFFQNARTADQLRRKNHGHIVK